MIVWRHQPAVKTAKPRPDITLAVVKWSRLWTWTIQKDDNLIARGVADTVKDAKTAVETAWKHLAMHEQLCLVQIKEAFARRPRDRY